VIVLGAFAVSSLSIWGIERRVIFRPAPAPMPFRQGIAEIWAERRARHFTLFVFLSMTAFFMQELIMEPYAGLVFGFTPGESTQMSGAQNGGVFLGMVFVGIALSGFRIGTLRNWVVIGCLGSAGMLGAIAFAAPAGLPLVPLVLGLGLFNGVFTVAAIGSMMQLAGQGREAREGTRMGLWGASQAIAAGFGGLAGAALVDVLRSVLETAPAFGTTFLLQAGLFLAAAVVAVRVIDAGRAPAPAVVAGE
jgi:BCD family chlorophyll transporter-like MFS transporter